MPTDPVREQVRQRYAEAALAVTSTQSDALTVLENDCGSAGPEANVSCCGSGADLGAAFGSALYGAEEQGALPAAASTSCSRPAGSARRVRSTAST